DILNGAQGEDADVLNAKIEAANGFTDALEPGAETSAYDGDWAAQQARDWLHGVTEEGQGSNPQAIIDTLVAGPNPSTEILTTGTDLINAADGQRVVGSTDTFNASDEINGGARIELSLGAKGSA